MRSSARVCVMGAVSGGEKKERLGTRVSGKSGAEKFQTPLPPSHHEEDSGGGGTMRLLLLGEIKRVTEAWKYSLRLGRVR